MTALIRQFWKCLKLSGFSRKRLLRSDRSGNVRIFRLFPEMTALIRQFWKCLKLSGFCQK